MNIGALHLGIKSLSPIRRKFSVSSTYNKTYSCKLLVVGGGSGGCAIAAKFVRKLPKDSVIILEPSTVHYYQPLWTLVGAGVKPVSVTARPMDSVLPRGATHVRDHAAGVDPQKNEVTTRDGHKIQYEYLVLAVGVSNDYDQIPGLKEALQDDQSCVATIYSPDYAEKVWRTIKNFKGGEAVFTYPNSLIKCPGAPQKIAYLADAYFSMTDVRSKSNITFNTCLPVIFGVKKYADELLKVVKRKGIKVNYTTVLKAIRPDKKEADYCQKDGSDNITMSYDMLHVTPPMSPPAFLSANRQLADETGYLDVDKYTLQHKKHPNIYGIGDCTNTPNSKTIAAIAKQSYVLEQNLQRTMARDEPRAHYDGYGACPLVTSYNKCILAEFIYGGVVRETFPFNQAKESTIAYYMKRDLFPFLYWNLMTRGYYHGPEFVRKIINPFGKD